MKFLKGSRNGFDKLKDDNSWDDKTDIVRRQMAEVFDSRNLSFLIGSGCSSLLYSGDQEPDDRELGIPTMRFLAKEFQGLFTSNHVADAEEVFVSKEQKEQIHDKIGIDLSSDNVKCDLEEMMTVLINAHQFYKANHKEALNSATSLIEDIIIGIQKFILQKCTKGSFSEGNENVVALYQRFYRSLATRSRGLAPPWVFTTNYDLFNERAMDLLSIPYSNGFSGTVERKFNPATYRLVLAEQLDITSRRWTAVDGFVHFCKLHGSINWIEEEKGLFSIRESHPPFDLAKNRVMIYPTPLKHRAIFGSPYSDMLREFQKQVVQDQSVLVIMGFGFRDEHINNIIFQGLTLPRFKLIVFMDPEENDIVNKLKKLADPRIWFIWGKNAETGEKAHHYDNIVNHLLPVNVDWKIEQAIENAQQTLTIKQQDTEDGE